MHRVFQALLATAAVALVMLSTPGRADSRDEITDKSDGALAQLTGHARGVDKLIKRAVGVLVFPDIVKMGFGEGGQYGEGALLVGGEPVAFYATAGEHYGLPLGANSKAEVILFMTSEALLAFRNSLSWQVGVDAGVSPVKLRPDGAIESGREAAPVLSFSFSDQGLLHDLDMEGSRINRIAR